MSYYRKHRFYRRENFQSAAILVLALSIALALLSCLTGCSSLPATVAALGTNTNSVIIKVHSPWGSAEVYRNAKP